MPNSQDQKAIEKSLAVAQQFYSGVGSGLTAGDWSAAEKVLADDFTIFEADSLPYPGEFKGVEGLKKLLTSMATQHYSDFSFDILSQTASENHVVTGFKLIGKTEPLGIPFTHEVLEIIDIVDGRITRCRPFYWDTKDLAEKFPNK